MSQKQELTRNQALEPFGLLRQMTSELDRVFDEPWKMFNNWPALPVLKNGAMWAPKVDVVQKDNRLITRVDLPGVKKEDVSVDVRDGYLELSGERKSETEETKDNVYRSEREYGSFCRVVPLPEGVKLDQVTATFANGVLEVSVPLPPAKDVKARKIDIKEPVQAKPAA